MTPRVTHLHCKTKPRQEMEARSTIEIVAGNGILGDTSFGRRRRQILLVSEDVLAQLDLQPGQIRENIVVSSLDLDSLPPGTELRFGNTRMSITGPCDPCARMDEIRADLQQELQGKRGVLARAITDGQISVGDTVYVSLP